MLALLAQAAPGSSNLLESLAQLFSSVNMLAQPEHLVANLRTLSIVWAVVFVVVGLLCLFTGAKHYKTVTVALAFTVGLFVGYWMDRKLGTPYVVAGSMGLLFAVAAFPLMKYAVALFGGLAGAFIGANLWSGVAHALRTAQVADFSSETYWVGALVGLLFCGMLAFVLFKFSVVMISSVSGATIAVLGVLCLLLSFEPLQGSITAGLTASQIVVPLLVFVPAIIGLILQEAWGAAPAEGAE